MSASRLTLSKIAFSSFQRRVTMFLRGLVMADVSGMMVSGSDAM